MYVPVALGDASLVGMNARLVAEAPRKEIYEFAGNFTVLSHVGDVGAPVRDIYPGNA